jgi:hypothetical protein
MRILFASTSGGGHFSPAAIEEWRPDVVVRESAEFASQVAAERLGVAHAEIGIGLSMQADKLLPLAAPGLDTLRAHVGGPPDPDARSVRSLVLTMAPESLEDSSHATSSGLVRRFRAPTADSGESVLDAVGDPSAPLVYLSFGTEVPSRTREYFPGVYRDALDALAGMGLRILVTIGDERDPADLGPLPSSVRVERWVLPRTPSCARPPRWSDTAAPAPSCSRSPPASRWCSCPCSPISR